MSTCSLNAIAELTILVPPGWQLGLFGSAASCDGSGACVQGGSDVDLLLVHPPHSEKEASQLRRRLVAEVATLGRVADVTVLSTQELMSSGFWESEDVADLGTFVGNCAARFDS